MWSSGPKFLPGREQGLGSCPRPQPPPSSRRLFNVPCSVFQIGASKAIALASATTPLIAQAESESKTEPKKPASKRDLLWLLLLGLGTITGAAIFAGIFYVLTNSGHSDAEPEPEPITERQPQQYQEQSLTIESPAETLNGIEPNRYREELPPENPQDPEENTTIFATKSEQEINSYPETRIEEAQKSSDRTIEIPRASSEPLQVPTNRATVRPTTEDVTRIPQRIDIIEELLANLRSTDPTKRRKAIWELGQRGDSRAVQPLVDLMLESDSKQRCLILAALSEIGTRTLKPINRALSLSLQDNNSDVRKNAIRDLTRIYELLDRLSHLLRHALEDSDPEVRETAIWAMEMLDRIRTVPNTEQQRALPNWLTVEESSPEDIP
ncbi:MAG: HEAT repeat domain-containing protein [Oscillatoria sp. SIO1A7]|nr:HEAT repeat domain-containing protein [Oscillatoria sp. SIO1A7]